MYGKKLRARLLAANRAKNTGDKIKAIVRGFKLGELKPEFPGVAEPRTGKSMGDHCEDMAKEWNISRDSQDEWAVSSHKKLAAAYERGFFSDLIDLQRFAVVALAVAHIAGHVHVRQEVHFHLDRSRARTRACAIRPGTSARA